jgi:hypothetical protein
MEIQHKMENQENKDCPNCGQTIKAKAKLCRYCKASFQIDESNKPSSHCGKIQIFQVIGIFYLGITIANIAEFTLNSLFKVDLEDNILKYTKFILPLLLSSSIFIPTAFVLSKRLILCILPALILYQILLYPIVNIVAFIINKGDFSIIEIYRRRYRKMGHLC